MRRVVKARQKTTRGRRCLHPIDRTTHMARTVSKNPNKRPKGEGTIYQRASDGMFCASIELPSPDGRRRRKVVSAKTEAQVKEKLKVEKRTLIRDGDISTTNQTLATWMGVWFRTIASKNVRPKTAAVYRTHMNEYIIPSIGKTRLDKLTPDHVRKLHEFITTKPKDAEKPEKGVLSSTTALQSHRILSVALKYAEREGRVTRNVAELTDAPRKASVKLDILSAEDGVKVLHTVTDDRLGSRWAAALLTGARQGELLGLELDRVGDSLDLSWQLQRINWEHGCDSKCAMKRGTDCPSRKITFPADWEHRHLTGGLYLTRPKSSAGWRIIPLVDPLRSILERRIAVAETEPNPHGLLWTSDRKQPRRVKKEDMHGLLPLDGSPLDPARDNAAWHAVLERADVDQVRLHDARHTTASLLLAAGVPEKIIMEIMGHSSFVVTRKYQNVNLPQLRDAMTRLSALMPFTPPQLEG